MKNLKVSQKLITSFLFTIILSVIIGVVGIVGMFNLNTSMNDMYSGNIISLENMGKIRETIQNQRVVCSNLIIYDYQSSMYQTYKSQLTQMRTEIEEYFIGYEPSITGQKDRDAFDTGVGIYHKQFTDTLNEIMSYTDQNMDDKAAELLTEAEAVTNNMVNSFDTCYDIAQTEAKTASDNGAVLFTTMLIIIVAVILIAIVISMILAFYISGLIAKPMNRMKSALDKVGVEGDLNFSSDIIGAMEKDSLVRDEIGESMAAFIKMLKRQIDIGKTLEIIAGGDLTPNVQLISNNDTMGKALDKMLGELNDMFGEIKVASEQVNSGGEQVSSAAQALSQGATEQASAVEQLSASIQEIAVQVKENSQNADNASALAIETGNEVERGNVHMTEMLSAMNQINESSNEISKIIKVIDDIAFQTNILALNAAVEAARAGEAGKGFAVVADEVRNLASKSADAAKQTTALIEGSVRSVDAGTGIAHETANSLTLIAEKTGSVNSIIKGIAEACNSQTQGIQQINVGVDQISTVVQTNSATAEESAAASEELSSQANILLTNVEHFKIR